MLLLAGAPSQAATEQVARARDAVYPALVNVEAVVERFFDGRLVRSRSAGSGVIVSAAGHVLTNYHVAGHTVRLECTLPSGEVYPAKVVVHDPLTDLSVLVLEVGARTAPLPVAMLGDSDTLEVGDVVLAMGNPLALASSMTQGIVSNTARVFADRGRAEIESFDLEDGEPTGLFTRWIQHDALILPGNSGGPLVDLEGRVVGINELGGSGIGFAIPSSIARWVLDQALARGEVVRGWVGVAIQPVGQLGRDSGALVGSVQEGGPAGQAGLEPGDVVLTVDGVATDVRFLEQVPVFSQRVAELVPGRHVVFEVEHDGKTRRVDVEVARMEPFTGEEDEVRSLGVSLQEITAPAALLRGLPRHGLLVTGVRPGRPFDAARPRPMPGDVLLALGTTPVGSLTEVEAALEKLSGRTLARFWRSGEEIATVIERKESQARRWGGELPKAWLGIGTQVLTTDLAEALGIPQTRGFRVTRVYTGTSAAKAGLAVGDVITAIGETTLSASTAQDGELLRQALEAHDPGTKVTLAVLRDGQPTSLVAQLEEEPRGAAAAVEVRREDLELTVREIALEDRLRERWPADATGALVAEATTGGWAHLAGLRAGDLVLEVSGTTVLGPTDFSKVIAALLEAREAVIPILVRRGTRTLFVFVEPDGDSQP